MDRHRDIINPPNQAEHQAKLARKFLELLLKAHNQYPTVKFTFVHESLLLEGEPEECNNFRRVLEE